MVECLVVVERDRLVRRIGGGTLGLGRDLDDCVVDLLGYVSNSPRGSPLRPCDAIGHEQIEQRASQSHHGYDDTKAHEAV
jgi:hypothetical protein